ncbi:MAG: 4-hydroxy-tetrahydrodipicolinate reductase [Promethearchaeota archaeon]
MKIAIFGADGSMGHHVTRLALDGGDVEIVGAFSEEGSPDLGVDIASLVGHSPVGVNIADISNLAEKLNACQPDVIIDFTIAKATELNAKIVLDCGIKLVVGTTGLSQQFIGDLDAKARAVGVPLVLASNMAVGMNLFMNVVGMVAGALKDWDIEIIEAHHHRKRDSPSGTALTLASIISRALDADLDSIAKYGRGKGPNKRKIGGKELGIHAVRAGDIVGDHTVLFAGPGERIELVHRAHDRSCFASGALIAAKYLMKEGLEPGIHSMKEVLGL